MARNCPSNPSNPSNASTQVLPYFWILDASDAPWTLQTLQNLALARLWALGSVRDCGRSCADCWLGALWPETALQTPQTPQTLRHLPMVLPYFWILDASDAPWTLQTLQNLALARLWALGSVRDCGRSCAACGLGALARQIFFFLVAETALQTPQTPQTLRHLPMVLPYFWILDASDAPWTLQTLQSLALARLWALGSVRDCGRSCAACGLGALARQIYIFLVARNCPSNPSNPSNASTLANGSAILLDSGRFRRSMDASDAPKPRTC